MKSEGDGRSASLYLIRSYDHEKRDTPDQSRDATRRATMRSSRSNTGISTATNATHRRNGLEKRLGEINYEKAHQLEVWQVARAATAAKFYFESLKIQHARRDKVFIEFTDGGFCQANNPTRTGKQEIEDLHGDFTVGIVVSIGTARKFKRDAKKATFFSTIPDSAREFADTATDPEVVHEGMQRDHDKHTEFPYFRLNFPGGLQTELDEWKPKPNMFNKKDGGSKTIDAMNRAFNEWAVRHENMQTLQQCAAQLVDCRRARMWTGKWERYAIGSHYTCGIRGCDPGDFYEKGLFKGHLRRVHGYEEEAAKDEAKRRRRFWRYRAPTR